MLKQSCLLFLLGTLGVLAGCQTEDECPRSCNPYNNPCYDPCMPAPCSPCAPCNSCNSCNPGGTWGTAPPASTYQTTPVSPSPSCGCQNETTRQSSDSLFGSSDSVRFMGQSPENRSSGAVFDPGRSVRFAGQSPERGQWSTSEYSVRSAPLNQTGYATVSNAVCDVQNSTTVSSPSPLGLWEAIVGVVGRYFPIEKEEPCREIGGEITPGSLMTRPTPGASLLEPWKGDSVGYEQRLESTLQSIRRFALVRVWPVGDNSYSVEVIVQKELENMPYPMNSNKYVGSYAYNDTVRSPRNLADAPRSSWTNLGRDVALEQKILREISSAAQAGTLSCQ